MSSTGLSPMTQTGKPRQSIRYDTVTKRKLKVTVSETGAVKEELV